MRLTGKVEHRALDRRLEAPEREGCVGRRPEAQVDGPDGWHQRSDPGRALVEERVLAPRRVAVVEVERRLERSVGQADLGLELRRGRADPSGGEAHPVHLVGGLVDDEVHLAVLLVERGLPDPAHVGVFVDEALPAAVDQDAVDQRARRREGSETSPAYMLRTAAPIACAMRMARPSSPSVPTLKVPRTSGGQ